MNTLLALHSFSSNQLINLFIWVAIAAVVIWGIIAVVRLSGITIPPIVRIVFIVLATILGILFLVKVFEALL